MLNLGEKESDFVSLISIALLSDVYYSQDNSSTLEITEGRLEVQWHPEIQEEGARRMHNHATDKPSRATVTRVLHDHASHLYSGARPPVHQGTIVRRCSSALFSIFHSFFIRFWESTLDKDFKVLLAEFIGAFGFWIYQDWRLFYLSTIINSNLVLIVFLFFIAFLVFWFKHVCWTRICDLYFQYDSRLNLLSCIRIKPCYAELNRVLGFCKSSLARELNSHLICQFVCLIAWKSFIHCS